MSGAGTGGGEGGAWSRVFRQASLAVTSAVATGTAIAAAVEVWRRARAFEVSSHRAQRRGRSSSRGLSWAEVVQHDRLDDAWVVVEGEVYDVSAFIEDHPGGRLLLLAFAGRDASEPFETVGHSTVARRQLRNMHVGTLDATGVAAVDHRAATAMHFGRSARLTGGPACTAQDAAALWEVERHGFLPNREPVGVEALRETAFEPFVDLVDLLPSLGFTGALRQRLDGDASLQQSLLACGNPGVLEGLSADQIERAFSVVGYTMVAYWRGGTLDYSMGVHGDSSLRQKRGGSCSIDKIAETLPLYLSKPMLLLSETVGRPPMIDYASTVLYNWARVDKNGPISMSNVRCVLRLTGLIDEEWFFKTHVVIESEASHAVAAVIAASRTDDDSELLTQLVALEEALWRVVRACLPIMYERSEDGTPKCSEHIFYQILRPLIKSGPLAFEGDAPPSETGAAGAERPPQRNLSGPSGAMSTLMPCIDAALGIQMTSGKLREAMKTFKQSMPKPHRDFIDELLGAPNIRQRIMLSRPVAAEQNEHHDALVRAFNRVISRVLDFRWQHWQYVKNFIMRPGNLSHATGSGGTTFDFLQQHITDTESARLAERQEGYSRLHTPGAADWPPLKLPPVAHHPAQEFWSVDSAHGLLAREPLASPSQAAWAGSVPPAVLASLETAWVLAQCLPSLCAADGPFFERCQRAAEKMAALQEERAISSLSEGAREHLMTTLCHIAAGCIGCGHRRPPPCIEKPLRVVARSVGRPPRLDFTELVLANWDATCIGVATGPRAAKGEAEQSASVGAASGDPASPGMPQLHVVWRFLASPDEEWYRAIHVVMHHEARDVVSAIRVGHVAMRDQNDAGVTGSLEKLSTWLNTFCDYFDGHFETKDSRTESVMMRRLEPFISHGSMHDLTWEETACWVFCNGSSVLAPAIHAFLGVRQSPGGGEGGAESTEGERLAQLVRRTLEEVRVYMPRNHREFLESIERPGVSVRQYCFRRFGAKLLVSVEALHDLEVAYNDALNALTRFVSRRVHLVSRLFPGFASMFGALHSDFEDHMRARRLQLLKMRQRVSRCMER